MYCVTQPAPMPTLLWCADVVIAAAVYGPSSAVKDRRSTTGWTFSHANVG
jgi:hypothetical protein